MRFRMLLAAMSVAVAVVLVVQGCGSREPEPRSITAEELKPLIDEAFKSYLEESRRKTFEVVLARAKDLAKLEMERLNEAEKAYHKDEMRMRVIPGPLTYGWYVRQYRVYDTATPADIVEDESMVVACNVYVKYEYALYETTRYHNTFDEDPLVNAKLETEFHKTDHTGYVVLSYGFDTDYEYNGVPPAVIFKKGTRDELDNGMQAIGQNVEFGAHWVSWSSVRAYRNR